MTGLAPQLANGPHRNDLEEVNRRFYNRLWSGSKLIDPSRFNTWPLIADLANRSPSRLEVGPGKRPRLPIDRTHFVDISSPALAALASRGGHSVAASIAELPYSDNSFDLVCALDIIEHVDDDHGALAELVRVARPGAAILLSTPLHPESWTAFDELVGHYRRYAPARLTEMLDAHGLVVEMSAAFGMKPQSSRLVDFGMGFMQRWPNHAMFFYNRLFMPLALRFQKPLALEDGLLDTEEVGEIFLLCRMPGSL